MRLLLVEDDKLLTQKLVAELMSQHYAVDVATDGEMGWNYAQSVTYDLILLEVSLSKRDGITLCRQLRDKNYHGPILLLSAYQENGAKVRGLDAGADDYVLKPCTTEELLARIRALLRRRDAFSTPLLVWGDLCLDPSTCQVSFKDQVLSLSAKEYSLIELLIRQPRRIFSSDVILDQLWSFDNVPSKDTVRAHIKRLRKKLQEVGAEDCIETVYGMGYRLKVLGTKAASSDTAPIHSTVAQAWKILKTPVLERVALCEAFMAQPTAETHREQALHTAHQFAEFQMNKFDAASSSLVEHEIENLVQQWNEYPKLFQLTQLVKPLKIESEESSLSFNHKSLGYPSSPIASHQLLLISQDHLFASKLQTLGTLAYIKVNTVFTLTEVQEQIKQRSPHLILLDLPSLNQATNGLFFLEELATQYPHLPILVLTVHKELSTRLEIARRGGKRFISKSLATEQLLAMIQETLSFISLNDIKVLAVDDDLLLLEALQQFLPSWGIQLTTLNDPRQFWETLTHTNPDILLLNVEMPYITGIELCQVVRNDNQWDNLPILFLTSRKEKDLVHSLFSAGADDYVNKPFSESELITRIFNRLTRNRVLKNMQ